MLTRKQQRLLYFIHSRLQEDGVSPSFEEMKDALELKSKSGIHRLIGALEERGFLRRLPNRARALEVIKLPEGLEASAAESASPPANPSNSGFNPRVIEGALSDNTGHSGNDFPANAPSDGFAEDEAQSGYSVPVMGRIAAGVPISAIQDHTRSIAVPPDMIGPGSHFALEVKGDSMIEAGILDGDTVVIRQTSTATPGDIVVALVEDEEATLKTYRPQGASIALEAANPAYETRVLPAESVKVQGRLVGLVRNYN